MTKGPMTVSTRKRLTAEEALAHPLSYLVSSASKAEPIDLHRRPEVARLLALSGLGRQGEPGVDLDKIKVDTGSNTHLSPVSRPKR